MPPENIKRAIQKGTGELEGVNYEEITYEGYGPGGVAILINVITDNRNRTVADVRSILNKYNGSMGENGSVSWMFKRRGLIILDRTESDEKTFFNIVMDSGAYDFEVNEKNYFVFTEPGIVMDVREFLVSQGCVVNSADIELIPNSYQKVSIEDGYEFQKLMKLLDDNADVNRVYSNFDLEGISSI